MNFNSKNISALLILIGFCFLTFYSCKKEKGKDGSCTRKLFDNIFSGKIYLNCSQVPYANKKLILNQFVPAMHGDAAYSSNYIAYTDSLGNFAFTYQYPTYSYPCSGTSTLDQMTFSISASDDSITITVPKYNFDIIPIILRDTFDFELSIANAGTHSSLDTLYFGTDMQNYKWAVGPFTVGILDTLSLSINGSWKGIHYYQGISDSLFYGFGLMNFKTKDNVGQIYISHTLCAPMETNSISL